MSIEGSYKWWRENYASNAEFQRVCRVLEGYSVDCSAVEIDHFPPNAAYAGSPYDRKLTYAARPSLPLPKYLHRFRTGGGGMGGHASTTGSTFVAKVWTPQLQSQMTSSNFHGAMKQDIIDKKNLALSATYGKDRNLFNNLMIPAVSLVVRVGILSEGECYDLLNDLGAYR
jgi:hypothetical protein